MFNVRWLSALLIPLLLTFSACVVDGTDDGERLQLIVDQLFEENDFPGISVAIAKGQSDPLTVTAGYADVEHQVPVTPETGFFIGSISKNVFATIALILVDEERLRLDDPLSTYVAWPSGDDITIKMLMNHTSGVPEYLTSEKFQPGDNGIPDFFAFPKSAPEILTLMIDSAPAFEPGAIQQYSNTNGLLVGEVITKITGTSLVDVLKRHIATPLGLNGMYLYGETTTNYPRAQGYSAASHWGAKDGELINCSFADNALPDSADGSVVSTAADLLRYHQALRGDKLLSTSSWNAMTTVEPGLHNGLSYLLGEEQFGPYAGNVGRAMGHVAASIYYSDSETYVVLLVNRGDGALPLAGLVERWFGAVP
ncbi:MAG: beta-lactamase family protein [bacterium]|nr:beta-lactamase family protein [bacterium]